MKKLLFLILIAFTLSTGITRAASIEDLQCDDFPENSKCFCFLDTGDEAATDADTVVFDFLEDSVECQQECDNINAASYQYLSCFSESTGNVDLASTYQTYPQETTGEAVTTTETKQGAIIPRLNVQIPGLDFTDSVKIDPSTGEVTTNLLGLYVAAIYRYLLGAGAVLAVVMLMVGGVQYATSRGNAKAVDQAKERITNAIVGIILLFLAFNIAFLIDPRTVRFSSLSIKGIEGIDAIPPEGEDVNVRPNPTLTGDFATISGSFIIISTGNPIINKELLTNLQDAAIAFNEATGKSMVITSATRDLKKQATLFYNNCLNNATGQCSVPTCNPASSSVVQKTDGAYRLTGELAGVTDSSQIIDGLVRNAAYGNCPHTSGIALDIWCEGSSNYKADPDCQQDLIKSMTANGFCRLKSEAWHFEFAADPISTACSTGNNSIQYTTTKGKTFTPNTEQCQRWDFKNHYCVTDNPNYSPF